MTQTGVNWETIILALIAAVPGIIAAVYAAKAKNRAEGALAKGVENATSIGVVKAQTDGLASAMKDAGFQAGVKQEQDAAVVAVALDAKQAALIRATVQELLVAQQPHLVKSNGEPLHPPADPVPAALSEIKTVVDDVQPRVKAIESATSERLTKLEDKAPKPE